MLIALISDLHANMPATRAVLRRIDQIKPDRVLVLGDLVGYGPEPAEVVSVIMDRGYDCVMGNHDGGVTGAVPISLFREPNQSLLLKSAGLLNDDQKSWLANLPLTIQDDNWLAVHASPINPPFWTYLDSAMKCKEALAHIKQDLCFVGHTHRPGIVADKFGILNVRPGHRFVINPGSVGQPRDGDIRASFCTINTKTFEHKHYRVSYDISETLDAFSNLNIDRKTSKRLLGIRKE